MGEFCLLYVSGLGCSRSRQRNKGVIALISLSLAVVILLGSGYFSAIAVSCQWLIVIPNGR